MGMKKTTSLKASFWKFLCMLLVGLLGAAAVPFGLILAGTNMGFITYANYMESSAKNLAPVIAATPDLADVQIPMGCRYLVLDKNYQVVKTSLEGEDLDSAMEYAISGKANQNPDKQYLFVTRENEYVVLQYYVGSQFTNEWLYEHFPSPEILLYILIAINCIMVCIILTAKFAKNLRVQLSPLFEATEQVAQQNLDFEVGHSKIKEFEEVLYSFADMKDNLKSSLEQQWKAEQTQKEQIAALAHDLKTPLTVIQGNIDLINETELDAEQKKYAEYITESSEQMYFYIKTLIEISRAAVGYQIQKEKMDFGRYIQRLRMQIESLCRIKGIHLQVKVLSMPNSLEADAALLERAIMNIVNNALDYSPRGGTIYVEIGNLEDHIQISITDEGNGFTKEALKHAHERFFMDDQSRGSKMHFGMGLYIAESIVKQHGGTLTLENSKQTHGARVTMNLPC